MYVHLIVHSPFSPLSWKRKPLSSTGFFYSFIPPPFRCTHSYYSYVLFLWIFFDESSSFIYPPSLPNPYMRLNPFKILWSICSTKLVLSPHPSLTSKFLIPSLHATQPIFGPCYLLFVMCYPLSAPASWNHYPFIGAETFHAIYHCLNHETFISILE